MLLLYRLKEPVELPDPYSKHYYWGRSRCESFLSLFEVFHVVFEQNLR